MNQTDTNAFGAQAPALPEAKLMAAIFETRAMAEEGESALLGLIRQGEFEVRSLARIFSGALGALDVEEAPANGPRGERLRALIADLKGAGTAPPAPALDFLTGLGSWGDLASFGFTPDFVQAIATALRPGSAAVLAEIEEDWITPLDTRVEELGGHIIRTWCSDFDAWRKRPPQPQ